VKFEKNQRVTPSCWYALATGGTESHVFVFLRDLLPVKLMGKRNFAVVNLIPNK
jgi:hypothetical protein